MPENNSNNQTEKGATSNYSINPEDPSNFRGGRNPEEYRRPLPKKKGASARNIPLPNHINAMNTQNACTN